MPKLKIDGIEYNSEDLSTSAKAKLASLQFTEHQLNKLKQEIEALTTARASYLEQLKKEVENGAK